MRVTQRIAFHMERAADFVDELQDVPDVDERAVALALAAHEAREWAQALADEHGIEVVA